MRESGNGADFELYTLLNVIPSGIIKYAADDSARFAYVNRNFILALGYTEAQFQAKFHNCFREMIYPEDREAAEREILRQEGQGGIGKFDYRIEAADGRLHWFHDEGVRVIDQAGKAWYYVTLVDISEQKDTEERLRISEEENRLAIAHSGRVICRYNIAERSLRMSADAVSRLGLPELLTDLPDSQVLQGQISADTSEAYRDFFNRIHQGQPDGCATFQKRLPKGWRWLAAHFTTIFSREGQPLSAVISYVDVTDQNEKETVFKKWQQSLADRPEGSYTLFRCDLNKDAPFDSTEGTLIRLPQSADSAPTFDACTRAYAEQRVYPEDREEYLATLNTDRLIAAFYRGQRSFTLEYRELAAPEGLRWLKRSVDLVERPNTRGLMAYLLFEDIDRQKRQELLTWARAETDPLTGILNRATFISRMEKALAQTPPGQTNALFMLDVDNFKRINDTLGHGAGDQVLRELTGQISAMLRHDDMLGRLGGDEFFVFLKNISRDGAAATAARICAIQLADLPGGLTVTVSLGIAMTPQDGTDFDTLYKTVDATLYRQKGAGKNGYLFAQAKENSADAE